MKRAPEIISWALLKLWSGKRAGGGGPKLLEGADDLPKPASDGGTHAARW